MHAYREQHPGASQQNTVSCVSLLWGKPISQQCVEDIWREYVCMNMRVQTHDGGDQFQLMAATTFNNTDH